MATEAPIVNILRDIEDDTAHALNIVHQNDSAKNIADDTEKAGVLALSHKNAANELVLPLVNEEGAQVVSFDAGTSITAPSAKVTPALKDTRTKVTETADLDPSKSFNKICAQVSCTRLTLFELVLIQDIGVADTETPVGYAYTDQGNLNFEIGKDLAKYVTDANVDVKKFVLYATNLDKVSDCYGSLACNQLADA